MFNSLNRADTPNVWGMKTPAPLSGLPCPQLRNLEGSLEFTLMHSKKMKSPVSGIMKTTLLLEMAWFVGPFNHNKRTKYFFQAMSWDMNSQTKFFPISAWTPSSVSAAAPEAKTRGWTFGKRADEIICFHVSVLESNQYFFWDPRTLPQIQRGA